MHPESIHTNVMTASPPTAPSAAERLDVELNALSQTVSELEKRLTSVTRPAPPHATEDPEQKNGPVSDLGRMVGALASQIGRLQNIIVNLDV
jgi:hypothetical protein